MRLEKTKFVIVDWQGKGTFEHCSIELVHSENEIYYALDYSRNGMMTALKENCIPYTHENLKKCKIVEMKPKPPKRLYKDSFNTSEPIPQNEGIEYWKHSNQLFY